MKGIDAQAATEFAGPSYDAGQIEIGRSVDGRGQHVQIANGEGRALHGLVTGDPGMGRTGVLEQVALGALESGAFRVMFTKGDPDGRLALDRFGRGADGDAAGFHMQLWAVEAFVELRREQRRKVDGRDFNPSPQRPGLVWLIKGLDAVLRDANIAKRVQGLLPSAAKAGVSVWGITEGLELTADFGGFAMVRTELTRRQIVAFAGSSRYDHTFPNGAVVDGRELPYAPGWAQLGTLRGVEEIRTHHVSDAQRWVDAARQPAWDDEAREVFERHALDVSS
jgi:hypothetical protein